MESTIRGLLPGKGYWKILNVSERMQPDFDPLQRDLELARTVQERMHPARLPEFEGYSLFAETTPVTWGNGDFYDVLPVAPRLAEAGYVLTTCESPEQAVLVVGDATGHGVASALLATDIRAMLRMSIRTGVYHRVLVRSLNEQLNEELLPEHFVTMWMGRLHIEKHAIRFLSMGQAPYFFYEAAEGRCRCGKAHLPPLGTVECLDDYEPEVFTFSEGDLLILPTDGYIESHAPGQEIYGAERFKKCIEAYAGEPLPALHEALQKDIEAYTGQRHPSDDRTILMVRRECSIESVGY